MTHSLSQNLLPPTLETFLIKDFHTYSKCPKFCEFKKKVLYADFPNLPSYTGAACNFFQVSFKVCSPEEAPNKTHWKEVLPLLKVYKVIFPV